MTYASQANIETRYPGALDQAGPRDPVTGDLDTDAIAAALNYADNIIDSYLGPRYGLPLITPAPAWLVDLAVDLALYRVTPAPVLDDFADRHTRAIAALDYLRDVHDGKLDPPSSPASPNPPAGSAPSIDVEFSDDRRDFSGDY